MAFLTRSLHVLRKVCNGPGLAYSTLRPPATRVSLVRVTQKFYTTQSTDRPRIAGSLTNIQSTAKVTPPLTDEPTSKEQEQKEQEEEKERRERSKRFIKHGFISIGGVLGVSLSFMIYNMTRPNYDEQGNVIKDEFSDLPFIQQVYKRFQKELNYYTKLVQEPSRDKLLPDPLKYPYIQPPYTLVLELDDLLIHPDWTYHTGWRFKKRPGVDKFLESVAIPNFEIVVYTAQTGMTVFPILDALDPNGYIMYRLVRDATRFVDGHHVKDLDALNRDLSKVIVVDWNPNSVKLHPENTLIIPRWSGNDDDTTLYDLTAFLRIILTSGVEDVRNVLAYYKQFDNPLEAFRKNQQALLVKMEEEENRAKQEQNKVLTSKWKPSFFQNR